MITQLYRVREGNLVISNIAATYGSIALVPKEMDGMVVSKEYTVLEVNPEYDPRVVWAILRSPEIRAEMLLLTTGANRARIRWADIKDIAFPYPDAETVRRFVKHIKDAEVARAKASEEHERAIAGLNANLLLDHERAHFILEAFKPPR